MLALRFPKARVIGVDIRKQNPTELHLSDGIFDNLTRITGDVYDDGVIASVMEQTPKDGTCILLGTHLCGDLSRVVIDMVAKYPEKVSAAIVAPCCLMRQKKIKKWAKNGGWGMDTTSLARATKKDPFEYWLARLLDRAKSIAGGDAIIVKDEDMLTNKNSFIVIRRNNHPRQQRKVQEKEGPVLCQEVHLRACIQQTKSIKI